MSVILIGRLIGKAVCSAMKDNDNSDNHQYLHSYDNQYHPAQGHPNQYHQNQYTNYPPQALHPQTENTAPYGSYNYYNPQSHGQPCSCNECHTGYMAAAPMTRRECRRGGNRCRRAARRGDRYGAPMCAACGPADDYTWGRDMERFRHRGLIGTLAQEVGSSIGQSISNRRNRGNREYETGVSADYVAPERSTITTTTDPKRVRDRRASLDEEDLEQSGDLPPPYDEMYPGAEKRRSVEVLVPENRRREGKLG